MDFHDGRNRVRRRPNERYCDATVAEHDRYGGGLVMVWAGISLRGRTHLYVIENGSLTGVSYRDEILHNIVRPYAGATGPDFILMDDNARPHTARVVEQYLQAETIDCIDWPARSPDINPIEHAWDLLQAAVSARPVQTASLHRARNCTDGGMGCCPTETAHQPHREHEKLTLYNRRIVWKYWTRCTERQAVGE